MRLHISLDDDVVAELDRRIGRRRRSGFIAALIRRALDDERRWDDIEAGLGALAGEGPRDEGPCEDRPDNVYPWDDDPGQWVRAQRRGDDRRSG